MLDPDKLPIGEYQIRAEGREQAKELMEWSISHQLHPINNTRYSYLAGTLIVTEGSTRLYGYDCSYSQRHEDHVDYRTVLCADGKTFRKGERL